ncbi:hypothetical protein RSAG8_13675, partial [Rhizoctonia solani AG-8 WAC10335]
MKTEEMEYADKFSISIHPFTPSVKYPSFGSPMRWAFTSALISQLLPLGILNSTVDDSPLF